MTRKEPDNRLSRKDRELIAQKEEELTVALDAENFTPVTTAVRKPDGEVISRSSVTEDEFTELIKELPPILDISNGRRL